MKPIEPDILYLFDQWIANRPDGGTICDTVSESFGVEKSKLHGGMVGTAATVASLKLMASANDPLVKFLGLLGIVAGGVAVFNYLEAPRVRPVSRPVRRAVQGRRAA
jgi:hypothetical protein